MIHYYFFEKSNIRNPLAYGCTAGGTARITRVVRMRTRLSANGSLVKLRCLLQLRVRSEVVLNPKLSTGLLQKCIDCARDVTVCAALNSVVGTRLSFRSSG